MASQGGGWPPQQQQPQPYPGQGQPYPPPGGGAPYPGGGAYPPQQPAPQGKAVTALILAILGVFCCGAFTSVPAIFLAKSDLDAINRGALPPTNKTMAQVAFWIGIVWTVLWVLGVILYIIAIAFAGLDLR